MTTRPYRPSNGSEGEDFMGRFCHRCSRYQGCDILPRALGSSMHDPGFPPEWVEEDVSLDGYLTLRDYLVALDERCTAFEPVP